VDPATANHRIAAALDRVGLTAAAGKRYRAYSLGMRQRLSIAAALLRPRDLLVLDEPTNGLDPQGTREVRTLIRELAGEGLTVFLSSHLLAEVEQICSHVGVMSVGRLVYQGRLEDLHARGGRRLQVITPDPDPALAVLTRLGARDVRPGERTADGVVLNLSLDGLAPEDVAVALVQAAVRLRGLTVLGAALEDVFVELTGEGFDVAQ
jgi:ABC-2 type transport system ATP-binding protein